MTRTDEIAALLQRCRDNPTRFIDGDNACLIPARDLAYLLRRVAELEAWQREALPYMGTFAGSRVADRLIAEAQAGQEVE